MKYNADLLKYIDTDSSCKFLYHLGVEEKESSQSECDKGKSKLFQKYYTKNQIKKPLEVAQIKNLPTYYFICSIIVIGIMFLKFAPVINDMRRDDFRFEFLLKNKFDFKYFSGNLIGLDLFSKILVVISQCLLITLIHSINTLLRKRNSQRMEDFASDRITQFIIYVFSLISISSMMSMVFSGEILKRISHMLGINNITILGLVDNIGFLIYICSTLIISIALYYQLKRLNSKFSYNTEYRSNLVIKVFFVCLLSIQGFLCINFK
jgi:hypothetical protein